MTAYFNDCIIGNSNLLACINSKGKLIRLFWPYIDREQHIEDFKMGICNIEDGNMTTWLDDEDAGWVCKQNYSENSNVLQSKYINKSLNYQITSTDAVTIKEDILIKNLKIKNLGTSIKNLNFIIYANFISNTHNLRSTFFDFDLDCLVYYKPNSYISISGSKKVTDFQITNNPYDAAIQSKFYGIDDIGMVSEGVQSWQLGNILPGEEKDINIYISCAPSIADLRKKLSAIKNKDFNYTINSINEYWFSYLRNSKQVKSNNKELDSLYYRSLLVLKLMSDEETGGILAAPEIDENFTRCGRYGYCWARDSTFITPALDKAGHGDMVSKFYKWVIKTQSHDGSWYQRYNIDGNIAPSWGMQIDEVGSLIWGILQHYETNHNIDFLNEAWKTIKNAADFLTSFIDDENKLPKACYDLWEERFGQHTYSCAAVYAGLNAAIKIDKILDKNYYKKDKWYNVARQVKEAIETILFDDSRKIFYRAINSTLEDWGFSGYGGRKEIIVNSKGYKRWVSNYDIMIDVSLLGLVIPFKLFNCYDERIVNTAIAIEEKLTNHKVGGIKRYETDNYIGGNPWIIATLWLALYYIEIKEYEKAKENLLWVERHKTYLGLLAEQVDKDTGKPAWVIPLSWSHAMYILVYLKLLDRGLI